MREVRRIRVNMCGKETDRVGGRRSDQKEKWRKDKMGIERYRCIECAVRHVAQNSDRVTGAFYCLWKQLTYRTPESLSI